jgi:hypothetical protein
MIDRRNSLSPPLPVVSKDLRFTDSPHCAGPPVKAASPVFLAPLERAGLWSHDRKNGDGVQSLRPPSGEETLLRRAHAFLLLRTGTGRRQRDTERRPAAGAALGGDLAPEGAEDTAADE